MKKRFGTNLHRWLRLGRIVIFSSLIFASYLTVVESGQINDECKRLEFCIKEFGLYKTHQFVKYREGCCEDLGGLRADRKESCKDGVSVWDIIEKYNWCKEILFNKEKFKKGKGNKISSDTRLRYDGIYWNYWKRNEFTLHCEYLRFYSDGTVIWSSLNVLPNDVMEFISNGLSKDVCKWFNKENPNLKKYTSIVTIEDYHLSFSISQKEGMVDYIGVIDGDLLKLDWYNHINQQRGTEHYIFQEW